MLQTVPLSQEKPRRSGVARCYPALVPSAIHAAQHERAGRDKGWERDRPFITGGQPCDKINTIAHHVLVNAIN